MQDRISKVSNSDNQPQDTLINPPITYIGSGLLLNIIKQMGVKAVWLIMLSIMAITLSVPLQIKAQSNSCNADSACSNWGTWHIESDSVPIVINGDTCYMKFGYEWRLCPSPLKIQIHTYQFTSPDSSCPFGPYLDSLRDANSSLLWLISDTIFAQADRRFGEKRFLIYRGDPPNSDCNCLYQVGCASNFGFIEIVSYYAECKDYIAVGALGGGVSPSCPGIVYVRDCNSNDCCILTRRMCYSNGQIRVCETVSPGSGTSNCTGNASFTPPAGCSILFRSGCRSVSCP